MKDLHKKISVILCFSALVLLGVLSLVLPKKDYSETENRFLEELPALSAENLTDGSFAEGLSTYLTDHFALRDMWIGLNTVYRRVTRKSEAGGILFADKGYYIEKYTPMERPDLIYRSINAFAENNPDVKVQVMLVPTAISVLSEYLPKASQTDEQLADLQTIYENLSCETIDVLAVLQDTEYAFYRLDHHWTTESAYRAYRCFCEANGYIARPEEEYEKVICSEEFCGTIYNKTIPLNPQKDKITRYDSPKSYMISVTFGGNTFDSLYFEEKLETADQYGYFLDGNHPLVTIESGAEGVKGHLLIIKDSYANCFVPFLTEHYKTITLVDPRYYGKSIHEYMEANGVDQVLFLYNLNTIGTDIGIRGIE